MSESVIRLGIIGMGLNNMASTFALIRHEPDLRYRLQALCSRREDHLEQCCQNFGVTAGTTDYRELVRRDDMDVVGVFSPDHLHADHCAAALEQGKHVICTKPMVTTLEDAKRLVRLVRTQKVKFLVGQTMRFDRQFIEARRLFHEGRLGELIALEAYYLHDMRPVFELTPWRLSVPQDFMFGGCVHSFDVIAAFGGDIRRVHAIANKGKLTEDYPQEDNFFINVEFASGVIGRVSGLYGVVEPPTLMMQFGAYGTKGSLQSEFTDNQPGEIRVVLDGPGGLEKTTTPFEAERDKSVYGHGATVIRYMRHFQQCLDEDRGPSPGVLDGARSVAAGVAAWESIRKGEPVEVFNDF